MNKPGIANECENGTNDACWTVEAFRHSSGTGGLILNIRPQGGAMPVEKGNVYLLPFL